jgi:hypothetical protein
VKVKGYTIEPGADLTVEGGAPDVNGGGVLNGSHVLFMFLFRRMLRRNMRLLGLFISGLVVRPPERAHKPRTGPLGRTSRLP